MRHRHRRFGGESLYVLDEPEATLSVTGALRDIAQCVYEELDTVRFMRGFLDAPEHYLRAALEE